MEPDKKEPEIPSPPASTGAIKKRSRVVSKDPNVAHPLLEEESDQDTTQDVPKPTSADSDVEPTPMCPDYFGVKSYLHQFYEVVKVKNPQMYDDIRPGMTVATDLAGAVDSDDDTGFRSLFRSKRRNRFHRCQSVCWRLSFWGGLFLLIFGLVILILGYLIPQRDYVVGYQHNLEIIDKTAQAFNQNLDEAKIYGLVIFCVGGSLVGVVLLFPSIFSDTWELDDVRMFSVTEETKRKPNKRPKDEPKSPTDKKIPATEELTNVQPQWSDPEFVATKEGLCAVP